MSSNILTVDLEDWFHILELDINDSISDWPKLPSRVISQTEKLLNLFERHDVKATFFILGWIAERFPELINSIASAGHDIGSHGFSHRLLYEQTSDEVRDDLLRAQDAIVASCGVFPEKYRAPGFSITDSNLYVLEVIRMCGHTVDCSLFPCSRSHGGIKSLNVHEPVEIVLKGDLTLIELPMSINKSPFMKLAYSGGGYFRLAPQFLIKLLFERNNYNITYFHPRDFDYFQPRLNNISYLKYFKTYYGLRKSFDKLEWLLESFSFQSIGDYLKESQITDKIVLDTYQNGDRMK